VRLGPLAVDRVTFAGALDAIEELVSAGRGGAVFTPNVDHVVNASSDAAFRAAYRDADLSLVDGMPLLLASRLLGDPLPEKASGSDLFEPLLARAAQRGWRVFLAAGRRASPSRPARGSSRGTRAADRGDGRSAHLGREAPAAPARTTTAAEALRRIRGARADLVMVGFGSPKQELWIPPAPRRALGRRWPWRAGRPSTSPRAPPAARPPGSPTTRWSGLPPGAGAPPPVAPLPGERPEFLLILGSDLLEHARRLP
jgi:N-acetylglucosaminyldiphosphoundecaprenol N-acetyl-beta-D-mannosaminyltransferase